VKALGKLLWIGVHLILGVSASAAVLTHRYPFSTDCNDAVGSANGVLQGNAVLGDGALVLSGTNASVLLPANLLTNFGSTSIEVWFADNPVNGTNAQIFSFNGTQSQLSYALGGEAVFKAGTTSSIVNLTFPPLGGTNHLIWALDEGTRDNLIDVVSFQQRKSFPIINYNIVPLPLSGLWNTISPEFVPYSDLALNNPLPGPQFSGLNPIAFRGFIEETELQDLDSLFSESVTQSPVFERATVKMRVVTYPIMPTTPFGFDVVLEGFNGTEGNPL